ncbi:oligosaccharide flippase family protein [Desulfosediminicola flagellatus]|uniref:oligosaccharide flippase family protein n=1 Tax=Desulfosediminicola flagellatus TaxID=2569541 RepID=UPI0010ACA161|nr:oligosaccharide flippase family protein [Desulfosediminicola flagellatus]
MPTTQIESTNSENQSNNEGSRSLIKSVIRVLFTRGLGPVSSFVLMFLLARLLGAEASGAFYLSITMMMLLSILAKFGFDTALQRLAGIAVMLEDWAKARAIYRKSMIISFLFSLILAVAILALSPILAPVVLKNSEYANVLNVINISIIPFSLLGIQAAMLKAMGKPAWGGFIEVAALPTMTILLLSVVSVFTTFSALSVSICYLAATVFTALLGWIVVQKSFPASAGVTIVSTRSLLASCIPLTLIELMNYGMLWTPFLFLGIFSDGAEAGSYNVAYRLSAQLGLLIIVLSSITAPRFASFHDADDMTGFMDLAQRSTRMLVLLGIFPVGILVCWPGFILNIFGTEFTAASTSLVILAAGQMFNLVTGPVGYLLAMTGNEKTLRNILIITTLLTIILSAVLIPTFGASGAAMAVSISMVFNNLACCFQVQKRLNLPFLLVFGSRAGAGG